MLDSMEGFQDLSSVGGDPSTPLGAVTATSGEDVKHPEDVKARSASPPVGEEEDPG